MNKILKVLILFSVISLKALEEHKESDLNKDFELISTEGNQYKLKRSAAMNSNVVKALLEEHPNETKFETHIPSNILKNLVKGLIIINQNKGPRETNIADKIIKEAFKNIPDKNLVQLVLNANKLLSPILEKAAERKYAMALKKNRKQLIKLAIANFDKQLRNEISKEYYLLYGKDIQIRGPKEKRKEIGFSIEELLKERKLKDRIDAYIEGKKYGDEDDTYRGEKYTLTLKNLKINSLKGLEKIPKISEAIEIHLPKNKISDLAGINIAKDVTYLNFDNNRIKTLGNNLNELIKLERLSLINNSLKTLGNSLDNLPQLRLVYLSGNPIKEPEIKRLKETYPHITFILANPNEDNYPEDQQNHDGQNAEN